MNLPSLLSTTHAHLPKQEALVEVEEQFSEGEDSVAHPSAVEQVFRESARAEVVLKATISTTTIAVDEGVEAVVLVGKTMISHRETETPRSTFARIGS